MLEHPVNQCRLVAVRQCDRWVDRQYRIAVAAAIIPPERLLNKLYTQPQELTWLLGLAFVNTMTLHYRR